MAVSQRNILRVGSNHNLLANRHQGNPHRQYLLRQQPGGYSLVCPVYINPGLNDCNPILQVYGRSTFSGEGGSKVKLRVDGADGPALILNAQAHAGGIDGMYIGFVGADQLYINAETIFPYSHMLHIEGGDPAVRFGETGFEPWSVAFPSEFQSRMTFAQNIVTEDYTMGDDDYTVIVNDINTVTATAIWEFEDVGSAWADVTTAYSTVGGARPPLPTDQDLLYVGFTSPWTTMDFELTQDGSVILSALWQNSTNVPGWSVFVPSPDGTLDFRQSGIADHTGLNLSWAPRLIGHPGEVTPLYWIRIKRGTAVIAPDLPEMGRVRITATNTTLNPRTITLPLASSPSTIQGRTVKVKDGTGLCSPEIPIKVLAQGGDSIDGAPFQLMTMTREAWTIESSGATDWYIT
jgi:hypothetical protein